MTQSALLQQSPIRRTKLYEIVVERVEQAIEAGDLKPGDRLPSERTFMAVYGVGRPAIREALLILERKGLIITENGRRAKVQRPNMGTVLGSMDSVVHLMMADTATLSNLFDARTFIEAAMARHGATAMDRQAVEALKAALDSNEKAIGNRERFMKTDIAFHRLIFQSADNPLFDAVHAAMVNWLMDRWRQIKRTRATETLAFEGHKRIFEAIAVGDPDGADAAMRQHLESSRRIWLAQLQD